MNEGAPIIEEPHKLLPPKGFRVYPHRSTSRKIKQFFDRNGNQWQTVKAIAEEIGMPVEFVQRYIRKFPEQFNNSLITVGGIPLYTLRKGPESDLADRIAYVESHSLNLIPPTGPPREQRFAEGYLAAKYLNHRLPDITYAAGHVVPNQDLLKALAVTEEKLKELDGLSRIYLFQERRDNQGIPLWKAANLLRRANSFAEFVSLINTDQSIPHGGRNLAWMISTMNYVRMNVNDGRKSLGLDPYPGVEVDLPWNDNP